MITKQTFIRAAEMVKAIRDGEWTHCRPVWACDELTTGATYDVGDSDYDTETARNYNYTRAVHTAEAFILLFRESNQRFDQTRFLKACGLLSHAHVGPFHPDVDAVDPYNRL